MAHIQGSFIPLAIHCQEITVFIRPPPRIITACDSVCWVLTPRQFVIECKHPRMYTSPCASPVLPLYRQTNFYFILDAFYTKFSK